MNQDTKSRNIFTLFIVVLFIIFSYYIVKSFFDDNKPSNIYNEGSFKFVYDMSSIDKKLMYDENRTVDTVMKFYYSKTTEDTDKEKIFLSPSKIDYYTNGLKLSIKKDNYLDVYKLGDGKIYLTVMGTDLQYYKVIVSINNNTEEIDVTDKSWKQNDSNQISLFPYFYYKVINDNYSVSIEFPALLNKDKYTKEVYDELVKKIKKIVSYEEIDNSSNYYLLDIDDIRINDKTKLLLKNSKIDSYYSKNYESYSLTTISYLNQNNEYITISEINNIDNYIGTVSITGEYNYKDYNIRIIDNTSIIIKIDDNYYLINHSNKSISDIDSYLRGVLEIE